MSGADTAAFGEQLQRLRERRSEHRREGREENAELGRRIYELERYLSEVRAGQRHPNPNPNPNPNPYPYPYPYP